MATHITNATQLQNMNLDPNGDYILDNDVDLTGVDWTPIGYGAQQFTDLGVAGQFTGTFDGQGFTISNLSVSVTKYNLGDVAGLFGYLGNDRARVAQGNPPIKNAVISNLNITNVSLTGNYAMGGLMGFLIGATLANIHVTSVTLIWDGTSDLLSVGGLGGDCFGGEISGYTTSMYYCTVDGVTCSTANGNYIGGLLGDAYFSTDPNEFITHKCFAINVNITITGTNYKIGIGGLIGGGSIGTLYDSYCSGTMTGAFTNTLEASGGLIGELDKQFDGVDFVMPIIYNTYSNTILNMSGMDLYGVGGLFGVTYGGSVKNSYAVGLVTGTGVAVGGVIGDIYTDTTLINCSWYISINSLAIGSDASNDPISTLSSLSFGTDEPDNTAFYTTNHPVYAQ